MTRSIKVAAVSLALVLGASGCGDLLTGDKLSSDPNRRRPNSSLSVCRRTCSRRRKTPSR